MKIRHHRTSARLFRRIDRVTVAFCVGAFFLALNFFLPARRSDPPPSNATPSSAESNALFDGSRVRDFRFTIDGQDWWDRVLETAKTGDNLEADLEVDGALYPRVGLRIKGSSSAMVRSIKKPFNLKMNAFRDGQTLYGCTTLNFNNGAYDPTLTREKISYEIFRHYIPTPRSTYARVHLNGEYWGIYLLVEQINRSMLQQWFANADGPRFKGDAPDGTSLGSSQLNWLGDSVADYESNYELKTSAVAGAWERLISLIDNLNHTTDNAFQETIENRIHVDRALWYMALNNIVVNTDDYVGAGHNYYLYFDPADQRMNILPWDLNESFGVHGPRQDPSRLSPFYHEDSSNHPLSQRLLAVPRWRALYLAHLRTLARRWLDWDQVLGPLHYSYHESIRADVERDDNYLFSMERFDDRPTQFYTWMGHRIPPLEAFIRTRKTYLYQHEELARTGPLIQDVRIPSSITARTDSRISITARVSANVGVQSVVVRVERGSRFYDRPMKNTDGNIFEAWLTAPNDADTLRYYILATDTEGTVEVAPEEAEHRVFEYALIQE
jgi:hypothetical protein